MSRDTDSKTIADTGVTATAVARAVMQTCSGLLDAIERDPALAADLAAKFGPALSDISAINVARLEPKFGAFRVDDGTMEVNEEDISRLMAYVISDMRGYLASEHGNLSVDEIRNTLHDTVALFVLHELRHRTQGVGDFKTVQLVKAIDGRDRVARFDIQADRDAALALAAAKTGSRAADEFLEVYQQALYYSVQYFFKIYPANAERSDKVCRIAALLLMLARLQLYMAAGRLVTGGPTDAIHVKISDDRASIAVFGNEPFERLLVADNDVEDLPRFVREIESNNLDKALSSALTLAVALGLS